MDLLFDRREEAVQVDVEIAEAVGMDDGRHGFEWDYIFAFYLPAILFSTFRNIGRQLRRPD
jgi:hypothetical protein